MSYTQTYYHIVFSTKNRQPTLLKEHREELFRYLWGVLNNKKCHLYRINGFEDHIHILTSLHSSIALADLIRDLKTSSTSWIKREKIFPHFIGWQKSYSAFTKSDADKQMVIRYIMNQETHHQHESSLDELKRLLKEENIDFDVRYLE
jgi:REP-associated tyrosine transposase